MKETWQPHRCQARYAEFMTQVDFNIIYRPGTVGGKPDESLRSLEYRRKEGDTMDLTETFFRSGPVDMAGGPSESIVILIIKRKNSKSMKHAPYIVPVGFSDLDLHGNHLLDDQSLRERQEEWLIAIFLLKAFWITKFLPRLLEKVKKANTAHKDY